MLLGSSVAHAQFPEENVGAPTATWGDFTFDVHGYFRAPLRLGWRDRGDGTYNVRTPWLIDDDYFRSGFSYLRTEEQDWAELYLSVGTKYVTGTVALQDSLYSDWARPLLANQLGVSQGYLTLRYDIDGTRVKWKLTAKAGAFWDRFGYLENYDTYLFGRTHQMGGQLKVDALVGTLNVFGLVGVGAHQEDIQSNQGFTMLDYAVAGVEKGHDFRAAFYYLDASVKDQRQLSMIEDADQTVYGLDVGVRNPFVGRLYAGGSVIDVTHGTFIGPALEAIHSYGGRGLEQNFFGDQSDHGTGTLWNFAFENDWSLRALEEHFGIPTKTGAWSDLEVRWFGLLTYTQSKQASLDPAMNRDGITSFKWGVEPMWRPLSWFILALRYDRVIPNMADDASSFRAITPRIGFTTAALSNAYVWLQYSHYSYGDRVALRPGQVPLETVPDPDVFVLKATYLF